MKTILVLLTFLIAGKSYTQNRVIIKGNVTGLNDGAKVYLVPNNGTAWRDSSVVKNGRFFFKFNLTKGHSYSLRLNKGYVIGAWKDFFLDKGVIKIKCTYGLIDECNVKGSQYAKDYNNYNKLLLSHSIYRIQNDIAKKNKVAEEKGDTVSASILYNEYLKMDSVKIRLDEKWVLTHPSSQISSYILYQDKFGRTTEEELENYLNNLTQEAKDNGLTKELENAIEAKRNTAIGKMAPEFTQNDINGNAISLIAFRGKYLLIDFWASWCIPCREDNPNLVIAYNKYKTNGFEILSVSLDNEKSKWIEAINKDNLTWTHVSDLMWWNNAVAKQYYIRSVPANLLLDREGKIIAKNLRGQELEKNLSELFK